MSGSDAIHDPELGILKTTNYPGHWKGAVDISGVRVDVRIDVEDQSGQLDSLLAYARGVVLFVQQNESRVRDMAVNELLEEVNQNWPDEEGLTADEFRDSLELESIHFSLDRYEKGPWAEVNYQCAELLEGWPVVHLDADTTIRYASLDIS